MKKIRKLFDIIINFVILIISLFIPKSKKIWLFGSWFGERFSDNSRYLYLYCNDNKEKLNLNKVIWVTSNEEIIDDLKKNNFLVVRKNTIKSYWYHLRAGYHFIDQSPDNIDKYFSIRSKRVQLWHGVGFKNISCIEKAPEFKMFSYKIKRYIKKIVSPGCWNEYMFLSTSEFATKNIFNLSFRLWENKVIESNYPRNIYIKNDYDIYIDNKQIRILELIKLKISQGKHIVGYFPTYREKPKLGEQGEKVYPFNIYTQDVFEKFDEYLCKEDIFIISKFHFAGDLSIIDTTENFINIENDIDVYPFMKYLDLMITDYSSLYADFLFLDKPIIFYPYDYSIYKNKDKGFLFDYNKVTPGTKVFDLEELKKAIINNLKLDNYKTERNKIKMMYFGENSDDTFDMLIEKIKSI